VRKNQAFSIGKCILSKENSEVTKTGKMRDARSPAKKIATMPTQAENSVTSGLSWMTMNSGQKKVYLSTSGVCSVTHGLFLHICIILIFFL
jgi:hypothetical protein